MDRYGTELNLHIPRNLELEEILLHEVKTRYGELVLEATALVGKKRNIEIPLGYCVGGRLTGCRVNYCSRERKFDYIQYSERGKRGAWYAKRIAL